MVKNESKGSKYREEVLQSLGFIPNEFGDFCHLMVDNGHIEFDFSANSIHGIVKNIYEKGIANGKAEAKEEIRKAIGVI